MIPVRAYKEYWDAMALRISSIGKVFLITDESELSAKIGAVSDGEILLIAVIPSSDSQATTADAITEFSTCLVYVLKKISKDSMDDCDLLDEREQTQQILSSVKEQMLSDSRNFSTGCPLMRGIDWGRMHTDPEYNYLGCNGWSLSFRLETPGL